MAKTADELFLAEAIELARKGVGLASPNPCVGAIIVDERGRIVGRGTHTYAGRKHAEVLAIEEAGERARGNTLYLNLEPCSHVGRTGPCADAVIAAGIHRVVCAMTDPNPAVSGRGFEKLRAAGVEVCVGLLEDEAKNLNEAFAKFIRTRRPLVTMKAAVSLDGYISPPNKRAGEVFYLVGEDAKAEVQRGRHGFDAILVGIGTVIADDPQLTDRSGLPRRRPLQRVVLDSRLRIPLDSKLVKTCNDDVIVFCATADEQKRKTLENNSVRVEILPAIDGLLDLNVVLKRLGELEITTLLVEGGSKVNAAFLAKDQADKLWLFRSPLVFGGGVPWVAHGATPDLGRLARVSTRQVGNDQVTEGYFRDPYA